MQQHDVYELVVDVVQASDMSPALSDDMQKIPAENKFDAEVIRRISSEYTKYISPDRAVKIVQQSQAGSETLYDFCFCLLDEIPSQNDR